MSKRIVLLALTILTFTLCIFTQGTFAWFTDVVSYQKTYEIGDIKYVYSGSLLNTSEQEIVIPGQELITSGSLFLTNQSKIDSNLRIQLHFSYTDQVTHLPVSETYTGNVANHLNNFMLIQMDPNWVLDQTDNCFHYKYGTTYTIPASTTADGYSFNLINSVKFDGTKVDNTLSGATFRLQIIFQAKQSQFVDWQTIGTQEIDNLVSAP